MTTRRALAVSGGITFVTAFYTAWLYPQLPDKVPTHWNAAGKVDQISDKFWPCVGIPLAMVAMIGLMLALPAISPRNYKIDPFRGTFNVIMVFVVTLLAYIHLIALYAGQHASFDSGKALVGGMMLFFVLLGNLMGKVRRNFFVGVRTPWTIASESVWVATHRMTGRLWVAMGLAGLALTWLGVNLLAVTALLLLSAFYPVLYSYLAWRKEEGSRLGGVM